MALPHGHASERIEHFAGLAERIVDLAADFRLRDAALYEKWYGKPHANPAWLDKICVWVARNLSGRYCANEVC